jgi:hypothetical protein
MSFGAPTPPDATATSNTQQQYNTQAAQTQNQTNSYNQNSAFGSINYVPDSSSPSGYTLQTSYSQPEQSLFNQYTGTQGAFGAAAPGLVSQGASDLTARANLDPSAVTGQLNNWSQQYLQPLFNQQQSNTDAQLRNQGLNPGSTADNNAQNLLARNQGDVTNQYLQQNEGQAYNQALQSFQAQQQQGQNESALGGTLFGASAPTGPTQNATPTASIQPANYQGAVQSNYQNQLQNYENTWNNVGKLGTAAAGLAFAPMTGGTSLIGSLGGMFGGSGVPGVSNSQIMSQGNPYGSAPQIGGGWG